MIRVERKAPPADLKAAADAELAAFEAFFDHGGDKPEFKAYKLASVRIALREIFRGKCAYCEAKVEHTSSFDVEHWRPKGKIRTESGLIDGYWWLAGDWNNLYLACPHCNRPTHHEAADGSTTAGKGMRFPISGGHVAAPARGVEASEAPLLLEPCASGEELQPERHLRFADSDEEVLGLVQAAGEPGAESELGVNSIEVYALNRKELRDDRLEKLKKVQLSMATIHSQLKLREIVPPGPGLDEIERTLSAHFGALKHYRDESSEYLLMTRQFVDPFLKKLGIDAL